MLQNIVRRAAVSSARRMAVARMSTAAESSSSMVLNFNLPHEVLYEGAPVTQVIVPGAAGEYGVTADHVPVVAQMKAGVLQIFHDDGEPEKYFVPGGFSLTHPNSVTDISCPEAVKLDDIDSAAVSGNFEAAKNSYASAEAGSAEQAESQVDMEVYRAMGAAIGLSLS